MIVVASGLACLLFAGCGDFVCYLTIVALWVTIGGGHVSFVGWRFR